jgi:hypothetical protein
MPYYLFSACTCAETYFLFSNIWLAASRTSWRLAKASAINGG